MASMTGWLTPQRFKVTSAPADRSTSVSLTCIVVMMVASGNWTFTIDKMSSLDGSFNATDETLVNGFSPRIALISAGHKETQSPGTFHGFFFGHPREDVVVLLESEITRKRAPSISGYTYVKGKNIKNGREIEKAIYCTCWDKDITVAVNAAGDEIVVTPSN
jgi:hypothetical protein